MELAGANPTPFSSGAELLSGTANYFVGNNPENWRTRIPTFARAQFCDVYPGIDLVYYGTGRQLEFDFAVAPGADPSTIALRISGADGFLINDAGDLELCVGEEAVRLNKPISYQIVNGQRRDIASNYVLTTVPEVRIRIGDYDPHFPLIIDPVLGYSTYLGGTGVEEGHAIAVDSAGNAYVTGSTASLNFPVTSNAYDKTYNGNTDAYIAKLDASGSNVVYATFLGDVGNDAGNGIAVDASGAAYIVGVTDSPAFPTTGGAYDRTYHGGTDTFVAKLSPDGSSLSYSTFLGGVGSDTGMAIALDDALRAHVTGSTDSPGFPTTAGAYDSAYHGGTDAFVTGLNSTGTQLLYSTFLGSSGKDQGMGIAVDSATNACVAGTTDSPLFPTTAGAYDRSLNGGTDAFIAKLNATGSTLLFSTYLGGTFDDVSAGIAVDASNNVYVTGSTVSLDFPTTPDAATRNNRGLADAFVAKLDSAGTNLMFGTYLGGARDDRGFAIAVDGAGNSYVTGTTVSENFPTTYGAPQRNLAGSVFYDAYVTKFDTTGSTRFYSTYLGGGLGAESGAGIAVDTNNNAYVTGTTSATDFPTTKGAYDRNLAFPSDAFVTKITSGFGPANDIAILSIKPPKKITLSASKTNVVGKVKVQIENRGQHDEIIQDIGMLSNLVHLAVQALPTAPNACPDLVATIQDGKPVLPLSLASKQKLTVTFEVNFSTACVPDPAASTKTEAHYDYNYVATVFHAALDGTADNHLPDDVCPRAPLGTDPYPDDKIKDKGCGAKQPDGTLGADVLTDVIVK